MSRADDEPATFVPLTAYVPPSSPVVRLAQRLLRRGRRILRRDEERAVEDDRLKQASRETIDDYTASPDCSLLAVELDATLGDWAEATGDVVAGDALRLVVIPPGDVEALLETWATRHGHAILEPPRFEQLVARETLELPPLDGDGVLVVPRLEKWFVRHRHGLALARALLAALSLGERRCVVGCNSWAWTYLRRVAEGDLLLPEPLTFAPFDATRLRHWFEELAEAEGTRSVVFRESRTGKDVFARRDDGELDSDFLSGLAARSRGIPWVAWQLWQRSLRTRRVDKDDAGEQERDVDADAREDAENTLWLVEADEFVMPVGHERAARLVLHALLLHGGLDADELARVLPSAGASNVVLALGRAGFVERVEGRYRCAACAYPATFESLATAGFNAPLA